MKNLLLVLALALMVLVPQVGNAQEVYNFYFNRSGNNAGAPSITKKEMDEVQKAVPDKVITVPLAPPASPTTTAAAPTPLQKAASSYPRWAIQLGSASTSSWGGSYDESGYIYSENETDPDVRDDYNIYSDQEHYASGIGITLTREFTRYLSLNSSFARVELEGIDEDYYHFSLGGTVTPIHLNIFGHDLIELGFQAGIQTNHDITRKYKESYNGHTQEYSTSSQSIASDTVTVDPYYGVKLAINITDTVALALDAKSSYRNKVDMSSSNFGVRYRF